MDIQAHLADLQRDQINKIQGGNTTFPPKGIGYNERIIISGQNIIPYQLGS
jgi:hypothetical protein